MRNPFRSEAEAFRLLIRVAAAGIAVAVVDAVAGTMTAVVFAGVAATTVVVAYVRREQPARRLPSAPAHLGPRDERRALLLVDSLPSEAVLVDVGARADRLLVVSPARTSRLRRWLSDVDGAREQARRRAADAVEQLHSAHVGADGVVGDEDPLRALDDALREFGGDEIVVATADEELVGRLRDRYAIPVTRV